MTLTYSFRKGRSLQVAERRRFVASLHVAGATYSQIAKAAAEKFGAENLPTRYDERQVANDIREVIKLTYDDAGEMLAVHKMVQFERYESILRAHWPRAMAGHLGATDRVLKAMKDENALLGIDAPQRHDVRVQQIDDRIERLMEALARRGQAEAADALGAGGSGATDTVVEGTARYLPVA